MRTGISCVALAVLLLGSAAAQAAPGVAAAALANGVRFSAREFKSNDDFFVADLDGNGTNDMLVMSAGHDRGWIYYNRGTRQAPRFDWVERAPFNISETTPEGISSHGVCVVDWNNDGAPDMLHVDNWALTICMNLGTAQSPNWWTAYQVPGTRRYAEQDADKDFSCFAADWDGDGKKDVLLSVVGRGLHKPAGGKLFFYRNTGTDAEPAFPDRAEVQDASGKPVLAPRVNVADWNGDGTPDVIAGEAASQDAGNGTDSILVYLGRKGSPTIVEAAQPVRDGAGKPIPAPTQSRVADLDGDGRLDLVVLPAGSFQLQWYRNAGSGSGAALERAPRPIALKGFGRMDGCFDPWLADFDGDGITDLLLSGSADIWCAAYPFRPRIRFYSGRSAQMPVFDTGRFMTGQGRIEMPAKWPPPGARCCPVDFNGDGATDLIYGFRRKEGLLVKLADGRTREGLDFVGEVLVPLKDTDDGRAVTCDLDGDGLWDLLVATGKDVRYFRNLGTKQAPKFEDYQVLTGAGAPIPAAKAALADLNADGRDDLLTVEKVAPWGKPDLIRLYLKTADGPATAFGEPAALCAGPDARPVVFNGPGREQERNLWIWAGDLTGDAVPDVVLSGDFYDLKGSTFLWQGEMWFFRGLPTAAAVNGLRMVKAGQDSLEVSWSPAGKDAQYEVAVADEPLNELTWPDARRLKTAETTARIDGLEAGRVYCVAVRPVIGGQPGHVCPSLRAATTPARLIVLRQGVAVPELNIAAYAGCRDVQIQAGTQREANLDGQGLAVSGSRAYFGPVPPPGQPDIDPTEQHADRYRRSLIAFDLDGLPAGAKIESARLLLVLRGPDDVRSPLIAREIGADWSEGGATWMSSAAGKAWAASGGGAGAFAARGALERYEINAPWCWDVTAAVAGAAAEKRPLSLILLEEKPLTSASRQWYDSEADDPALRPAIEIVIRE